MNGSARVVTPTEIGAMMNARVFIEGRVSLSDSSRFGKIRKQEIGCDERKQPDDDDVELVCVAECRYCATIFDAECDACINQTAQWGCPSC